MILRVKGCSMDYKDFGERVRKKRQQKGWTQELLAKELGVSTSFVGHIERGSRKASLETLVQISNVLGVSMDYLLAASLDSQPVEIEEKPNLPPHQRLVMKEILSTLKNQLDHWDYDAEEDNNK